MGYSQRFCQLCGVTFNIGRIRKKGEPPEAAWNGMYGPQEVVEGEYNDCEGCENVNRYIPEHVYSDGSSSEAQEVMEHIAGPNCTSHDGYTGWRISLEEMKGCLQVQCLAPKLEGWTEEANDQDFEKDAKLCFLTGISAGPPDEFNIEYLQPVRHGVQHAMINNGEMLMDDCTFPFHPHCFKLFERLSQERLGKIDIDGLWTLCVEHGDMSNRFEDFPETSDLKLVCQQFCEAVPGTEYLAANLLEIPGLDELINGCIIHRNFRNDTAFSEPKVSKVSGDIFARLSPELKLMIVLDLNKIDVTNLRLASNSFIQLPQKYFHSLVQLEMPWVWEIEKVQGETVDWFQLWCRLSKADGGSGADAVERQRIEQLYFEDPNRDEEPPTSEIMPKPTELKGLRNRRRIYGDIQEIITRIASLHMKERN